MRYRQWKKKYKNRYGHNPSVVVDARKRRKAVRRFVRVYQCVNDQVMLCVGNAVKVIGHFQSTIIDRCGRGKFD